MTYTFDEAAQQLGVSGTTLWTLVTRLRIRASASTVKPPRTRKEALFTQEDIDARKAAVAQGRIASANSGRLLSRRAHR